MDAIVITGGAGFIGSSLAVEVKHQRPNARVVAFDNLKRRGSELNLPRLRSAGVEFVHGDIRCPEDFEGLDDVDLMIECSAEPSVLAGYDAGPGYVINTNLTGTVNCLEFIRRRGASMIFLSTSRIYPFETLNGLKFTETDSRFELEDAQCIPGVSSEGVREDFPVDGARSMYGATKYASEVLLREYISMYGLKAVINRLSVIGGPWQMGKIDQGLVALWAARHVYNEPLSYIGYGGEGKQVRDVLHIDDLIRLLLLQMDRLDEFNGETFNAGGGRAVSASLRELTAMCSELTGNTIGMGSEKTDRPGDVRIFLTDNGHVTERTGWRPKKDMRAIVADTVAWIRDHEEELRPILG